MAKRTSSWRIGCAAISVLGIALIGLGYTYVGDSLDGFGEAATSRETLEGEFGTAEEFTPWSNGEIPPRQMEAFLAVREATGPARDAIAAQVSDRPLTPEKDLDLAGMSIKERMELAREISQSALDSSSGRGDFFKARNQALLDVGMGMGEYVYIYTLAYHSWLKLHTGQGVAALELEEEVGPETGSSVDDGVLVQRHPSLVAMLRNQLEALPEGEGDAGSQRFDLEEQIGTMEKHPGTAPWQDDLPDAILHSLQPYRQRLIETYDPLCAGFELSRSAKKGPLVWVE